MVMSQLLHHRMGSSRRQSRSPESSPRSLLPFPLFQPYSTSPQEGRRRSGTYSDQDEQFPFFTKVQSDEGYSSSLTSDSKSRLSCGSATSSERSKNIQVSPESKSSQISPVFDDSSKSCDSFGSAIQNKEVSSSGITPVISLDEDSQKSVSKFLPSFCDEKSNYGLPDSDIEIKIEPEDISSPTSTCTSPFRSVRSVATTSVTPIEVDFTTVKVKQEVESPVKFMNTNRDVMWAVKPDVQSKSNFVPSPEKSSSDCSSDYNRFPIPMYNQSWNTHYQAVPSIMPFTPLESQSKPKSKKTVGKKQPVMSSENIPMSMQTEAIDLSITKKRKATTPKKDSKQKRLKKGSDTECGMKQGTKAPIPILDQKRIWKRDPNHTKVLQESANHTKVLQESPNQNVSAPTTTEKPSTRRLPVVKQTRVKSDKVKTFQCNRCDKTYSQRSSLHTHMRIHTGVRPYVCKDCDRSFTDCSTYIKHCRLHTGEKPYACGVCGRCFTQSGNMMRHQQKCKGSA
ncbi:zinc finger and SCAN domain-containing protein 21-like [Haliotis rubra]|uniref:zinc finger and SCAN domain-containing protein 21-like n=1 Tax=Haliotis rubra TaxID=36100 RepID=UPI001EE4F53F|nr:zinc finger and SCAN domain-containing protein 21-like [Haliotis rubra]